jgi:hypothetical protein
MQARRSWHRQTLSSEQGFAGTGPMGACREHRFAAGVLPQTSQRHKLPPARPCDMIQTGRRDTNICIDMEDLEDELDFRYHRGLQPDVYYRCPTLEVRVFAK